MGHALLDPDTRLKASRETFSDPGDEIQALTRAQEIEGSQSLFRRITRAKNVGELLDCTTEIRYALIFLDMQFKVKFILPGTQKRPDLLVSRDGESAYVEVRRIRPPHPQCVPPVMNQHASVEHVLQQYGGDQDVRKIEQELRGKFRQVLAVKESNTIIATWSDRDFVEEVDFQQAVRNIRRSPTDPADGRAIPRGLLFCMFGWFWMESSAGQQVYGEPLRNLSEPFLTWLAELEQARV